MARPLRSNVHTVWVIPIPGSTLRNEPLFYATQDNERAKSLVEELTKEHGQEVKAMLVSIDNDDSIQTFGFVTEWKEVRG